MSPSLNHHHQLAQLPLQSLASVTPIMTYGEQDKREQERLSPCSALTKSKLLKIGVLSQGLARMCLIPPLFLPFSPPFFSRPFSPFFSFPFSSFFFFFPLLSSLLSILYYKYNQMQAYLRAHRLRQHEARVRDQMLVFGDL